MLWLPRASGCLYWICCGSNLRKRRLANINQLTLHIWSEHLTMANLTPGELMFIHRMLLNTVEFRWNLSVKFRLHIWGGCRDTLYNLMLLNDHANIYHSCKLPKLERRNRARTWMNIGYLSIWCLHEVFMKRKYIQVKRFSSKRKFKTDLILSIGN